MIRCVRPLAVGSVAVVFAIGLGMSATTLAGAAPSSHLSRTTSAGVRCWSTPELEAATPAQKLGDVAYSLDGFGLSIDLRGTISRSPLFHTSSQLTQLGFVVSYRGKTLYTESSFPPGLNEPGTPGLVSVSVGGAKGDVCIVASFDGSGPTALIGWQNGGALGTSFVWMFSLSRSLEPSVLDFGLDGRGIEIPSVDGRLLVVGGNGGYRFLFSCDACSADPIEIESLVNGHLVNVTSRYPSLVSSDASRWKRQLLQLGHNPENESSAFSATIAWIADECELGDGPAAWISFLAEEKAGSFPGLSAGANANATPAGARQALTKFGSCTSADLPGTER